MPLDSKTYLASSNAAAQYALKNFGYLDPPVDENFGPVSRWALSEVYKKTGKVYNVGDVPPDFIKVIHSTPHPYFHLNQNPDHEMANRLAKAYINHNYWFSVHPECVNISYIEGMSVNGKPNDNAPNKFNDLRLLWKVDDSGQPVLVGMWMATTEPGYFWTKNPMSPLGAARVKFGLYKAWGVGMHHTHEALVQVDDITVFRDLNQDYKRNGDKEDTGQFGINQHWGYDLDENDLGRSSAGCLVGRSKAGHVDFMHFVKNDARYRASNSYKFMTAIFPANEIPS